MIINKCLMTLSLTQVNLKILSKHIIYLLKGYLKRVLSKAIRVVLKVGYCLLLKLKINYKMHIKTNLN